MHVEPPVRLYKKRYGPQSLRKEIKGEMYLTLERLTKRFKGKLAVENVSAELTEGIYGFLGANGAGKTTLIQMICGIVEPTAGEVKLDGKNTVALGEDYRDLLGYLPQEFGYTPGFTARDFLLYISSIKGLEPRFARKKAEELLQLVNLAGEADHKIRTFSGGMKRRLGIAQALLNDPKILILDEPTAGLDPKERVYFRNLISGMSKEKIIMISTHIVSDIEYISDRILVMKKGRFILDGSSEELVKEVEGMVWECTIPQKEWPGFEQAYCIANAHNRGNMVEARVISERRPCQGAKQAAPDLEDLYLQCFQDER